MSHLSRPPRGQQRDKPYREALRMELAAAGENMMELREIAKVHIAKCKEGDMRAIRELADRLDGRPAQILDLNDPDKPTLTKIVHEIVHLEPMSREEFQRQLVDGRDETEAQTSANGNGHDQS